MIYTPVQIIWRFYLFPISSQLCHNRSSLLMMISFQHFLLTLVPSGVWFIMCSMAVETSACLSTMLCRAVNYLTACVPLIAANSPNIPIRKAWLDDYDDNIIYDYMEFGWPIGYMADGLPQMVSQGHTSAIAYRHHVDHFLAVELQHSALLGPFPNTNAPSWTHPNWYLDHRKTSSIDPS